MTILDTIRDANLFGRLPAFRDLGSWRPWLTFLSAMYGLELSDEEAARFRRHTGRNYDPPPGGWPEVVCVVGRQAGKSFVAALVAVYEAMRASVGRESAGLSSHMTRYMQWLASKIPVKRCRYLSYMIVSPLLR